MPRFVFLSAESSRPHVMMNLQTRSILVWYFGLNLRFIINRFRPGLTCLCVFYACMLCRPHFAFSARILRPHSPPASTSVRPHVAFTARVSCPRISLVCMSRACRASTRCRPHVACSAAFCTLSSAFFFTPLPAALPSRARDGSAAPPRSKRRRLARAEGSRPTRQADSWRKLGRASARSCAPGETRSTAPSR